MGDLLEFPVDPEAERRVLCDRIVAEGTALLAELREAHKTYRALAGRAPLEGAQQTSDMGNLIEFPLDPATKRRVLCDHVVAEATALLARRREEQSAYHASVACGVAAHRNVREYGAASESK